MPRASKSVAGSIVEFFRTASLDTADLILGLCKDAVADRKAKSTAARDRAKNPTVAVTREEAVASAAVATKRRKKPGPKKGSKRKLAAVPPVASTSSASEPGLPLVEEYGNEEAGDLVHT